MTLQAELEAANAKYAGGFSHSGKPSPPAKHVVWPLPQCPSPCMLSGVQTRAAEVAADRQLRTDKTRGITRR